jgi:hypothetical protein
MFKEDVKKTATSLTSKKTLHKIKYFAETHVVYQIVVIVILLLILPFFLTIITSEQDYRQQAANPTQGQGQSFTFTAAGDFGNDNNFKTNVNKIGAANPAFHIALGDFSYTENGEKAWCDTWEGKIKHLALIAGNHDSGQSRGGNINNYVKECPFSLKGVHGIFGKQYYFDYPSTNPFARFILVTPGLESTIGIDYSENGNGYVFTKNAIDDARTNGISWILVAFHKNCISAGEKGCEIGASYMELLLKSKVDLILQGHEHSYLRSKQLNCIKVQKYDKTCITDEDNSVEKGKGSIIHIIGTGGHDLRKINKDDPEFDYFAKTNNTAIGFGKFNVSQQNLKFDFVTTNGRQLNDSFTIVNTATSSASPTASSSATPAATSSATPTATTSSTLTPTFVCLGSCPTATPTPTPGNDDDQSKNRKGKKTEKKDTDKKNTDKIKDNKDSDNQKKDQDNKSLLERIQDIVDRIRKRLFGN